MSRFCPLLSSSKGNTTYLSGGGTSLLVDAGVSLRQLTIALGAHGFTPDQLCGVFVTHEHSDHIRGLPMLLKKHNIPLYASRGTLEYLCSHGYVPGHTKVTEVSQPVTVGGIEVTAFDTPHDASHSVGYKFVLPDQRTIAIATDLGHITDTVREHITGCDLVMLESNYDSRMLECSSYPWPLKRRIKGDYGHLQNEVCADECIRLIKSGTSRLILAHLSEQNNFPELARQVTKSFLDQAGMRENRDYILGIAPARGATSVTAF